MKFNHKHLIFLFAVLLIVFRFLVPPVNVLSWDVFGYYLYLPAKFIYHDLHLLDQSWLNKLIDSYQPTATLYQAVQLDNGNWAMKYSLGMAILYAPFFFIAYLLAEPLGFPADGLSLPFQYSLTIGGLVYAVIGLIFLSKILRKYFSNMTSGIVMLIIFAGTNYFQLTAFDGTLLSHNFLFALYAMLVYYTIRWHENPNIKFAVWVGLVCGLITLIRPSEVVCMIIPLFWNIYNKESLNQKFQLVRKSFLQVLVLGICIILMFIPQLYYWKTTTGKFLFYSYTNAGEGFDFSSPYLMSFLFSFRKGWLIYTPIMFFALIGFYYLLKQNKNLFFPLLIFIIADIYIISSWSCWWYAGGSFSSRSLVPAYVLLALPLGYFVEKIKSSAKLIIYAFAGVGFFFIILNLFQTWQFENGILSKERMTRAYYFATFGKTSVTDEDKKLLLIDRSLETEEYFSDEQDYSKKILYQNNFDENKNKKILSDSSGVFLLDSANQFSPGIKIAYDKITENDHAWIRAKAKIFFPEGYDEDTPLLVVTFVHNGQNYKYRSKGTAKDSIRFNEWNPVSIDYLTPEVFSESDSLCVYIWHRGKKAVLADEILVNTFEKIQ